MNRFASLLDRLILTPSRNGKLRLLIEYFTEVPDPERGFALAAITGELDIASVKPAMLRELVTARVDPILFAYSYDFVGDLAETVSLIWPEENQEKTGRNDVPTLADIVETLTSSSRREGPIHIEKWLSKLDSQGRYALIKLVTGGMRIGVSNRLAKQALAQFGSVDVTEIEELWHGLNPPYVQLFGWLEGVAEKPVNAIAAPFRPVMLAHPIEDKDLKRLEPQDFAAEWKWDGIRVQVTAQAEVTRIYSRSGDDISQSFPDLQNNIGCDVSMDGELLVARPGAAGIEIATFSDLQQRLNRKRVTARMLTDFPAFVRVYDILQLGQEDLRTLSFRERRRRLETFVPTLDPAIFDISPLIPCVDWHEMETLRNAPPHPVIEGIMLKRWDSPYVPGRPKGAWFKWKRDPHLIDAVLMYAQRGHGKRSGYYSDYTFGVWTEIDGIDQLVPVGKAYFGFTDAELKEIDKFVRNNTLERFGPVRSVRATKDAGLILEVAFEGLNRSSRHKSGVAMRFPRISRLRWDKPSNEADRLDALMKLLPQQNE